ncbi:hypothetical protein [Shewanella baltica]|uniref:hypothetical protein n=1 Tax=Shewanella baltica TaxID=62322 RepID=UPI003CFC8BFC
MNTSNLNIEKNFFPPLYKINQHAKFLSKNLPVTLCQAQEMVAYYQHCNSWVELKNSIKNGHGLRGRHTEKATGICHLKASEFRRKLLALLNSDWNSNIEHLHNTSLIEQTISHSIYNKKLDWLLDEEVCHLYYCLYDEDNDTPHSNLLEMLYYYDNNFLNLFHNFKESMIGRHFYDYRYGLRLFCHKNKHDGHVLYIIREFDTYFYPPCNDYTKKIHFRSQWLVNYVVGYINRLIEILSNDGQSGEIVLHRVNNEDCISSNSINSSQGILEISNRLQKQGAIKCNFFGADDPRIGLSLSFGK